jgi:hypothetical protein
MDQEACPTAPIAFAQAASRVAKMPMFSTAEFGCVRSSEIKLGLWRRSRPTAADAPLAALLLSRRPHTAPRGWIEPLKRQGGRAPQRHSHHADHPERDRVHRAGDLELPGCLC